MTAEEAHSAASINQLTREHIQAIEDLAEDRWYRRCAVLYSDEGTPQEIYFWGWSGD
ncbi:hypothetical protein [Peterkaempfera sp. SMS 1(5)a]|uniref:hypothetical protein n=1 Tax=Peterkaempfera podocarpi TaxID=3232308 RepID=UPI00366FC3E2